MSTTSLITVAELTDKIPSLLRFGARELSDIEKDQLEKTILQYAGNLNWRTGRFTRQDEIVYLVECGLAHNNGTFKFPSVAETTENNLINKIIAERKKALVPKVDQFLDKELFERLKSRAKQGKFSLLVDAHDFCMSHDIMCGEDFMHVLGSVLLDRGFGAIIVELRVTITWFNIPEKYFCISAQLYEISAKNIPKEIIENINRGLRVTAETSHIPKLHYEIADKYLAEYLKLVLIKNGFRASIKYVGGLNAEGLATYALIV